MAEAIHRSDDVAAAARVDRPRETLADATEHWLAALPDVLRPRALPARFPHMANELARRWNDRARLAAYLDELLIDTRGNRRGLPNDVADEIASLKDYFETVLHPVPQTVWDEVAGRSKRARAR